jgi:hypothetical protein
MGLIYDIPLTNSRGLGKIVFFTGLRFPMVITPSLLGEPILTAHAFYFLEQLECVARVQFESPDDMPSAESEEELMRKLEYVIDNYLFAYSKIHPDSKITSKISEFIFWRNDPCYHYFEYDWRMTECLVLDTLNDESIKLCRDDKHEVNDSWEDWCLFNCYFLPIHEEYRKSLEEAMKGTVFVRTQRHVSLGTGEAQLPIIKTRSKPLSLEQVRMFEVVRPRESRIGGSYYQVSRGFASASNFKVHQEELVITSYQDPSLLSYYFCALRDHAPVSQFKNFYNVLEYFFEDAPNILGITARRESEQLEAVIRCTVRASDLNTAIEAIGSESQNRVRRPRLTSSGETIPPLDLSASDIIKAYSNRLYSIRNACIHSKRIRRGRAEARITPATEDEHIVADELPLLRWIAAQCLENEDVFANQEQ